MGKKEKTMTRCHLTWFLGCVFHYLSIIYQVLENSKCHFLIIYKKYTSYTKLNLLQT